MSHFDTSDRTRLFYRDFGSGQPIVFVTSWALDSRRRLGARALVLTVNSIIVMQIFR